MAQWWLGIRDFLPQRSSGSVKGMWQNSGRVTSRLYMPRPPQASWWLGAGRVHWVSARKSRLSLVLSSVLRQHVLQVPPHGWNWLTR